MEVRREALSSTVYQQRADRRHRQLYSQYVDASVTNHHIIILIIATFTSIISRKVKASRTRYRALGPELTLVYRQSARR